MQAAMDLRQLNLGDFQAECADNGLRLTKKR